MGVLQELFSDNFVAPGLRGDLLLDTGEQFAHAPKGGITIAGQTFTGGEFIPKDVLAKATPAEQQQLDQPVEADLTERYHLAPELKAKIARAMPGHGRQLNLTKDEVHAVLSAGVVGFVSAGRNPNSAADQQLSDEQIAARHAQLQQKLVDMGCKFVPVHGKYGSEEDSFLVMVPDVSRQEVTDLGRQFNQDSVIYCEHGRNEMVFTTGENVGQAIVGRGWQTTPDADDFYSDLVTKDGKHFKFQLHFDFDAMVKLSRRLKAALADSLSLRAPEGYTAEHPLLVGGKPYLGGEFVPDDEMAKLSPMQKMFLDAEVQQHNAKREYDQKKADEKAAKEVAAQAKMPPVQLPDEAPRNDNIYPGDAELPPHLMAWTTNITPKHREALEQYSGEAGMSFNGPLHDLHGPLTHDWSTNQGGMADYYDNITKDIHFAIAEAPPLAQPLTVWRGLQPANDADAAKMKAEFEDSLKNGTAVHTTGFLSTTIKPSMALEYAKKTNAEGKMHGAPDAKMNANSFLLEIKAKHGIYLDGQSEHPEEREFVMDHWCAFKVTGVKQLTVNGEQVPVYQMEHVPEPQ